MDEARVGKEVDQLAQELDGAAGTLDPAAPTQAKRQPGEDLAVVAGQRLAGAAVPEVHPRVEERVGAKFPFTDRQPETLRQFAKLAAPDESTLPEGDLKTQYLAGARAVQQADYAAAFEAFIGVLEKDRDYANGAAKNACKPITIFILNIIYI